MGHMSSSSTSTAIGAHVDQTDPIAEAQARDTTLVQFFLGNPQSYKARSWSTPAVPKGCGPTRRRPASISTCTRPT